jgi:hypothetical protein
VGARRIASGSSASRPGPPGGVFALRGRSAGLGLSREGGRTVVPPGLWRSRHPAYLAAPDRQRDRLRSGPTKTGTGVLVHAADDQLGPRTASSSSTSARGRRGGTARTSRADTVSACCSAANPSTTGPCGAPSGCAHKLAEALAGTLRLENGWNGQPAQSGWRPARTARPRPEPPFGAGMGDCASAARCRRERPSWPFHQRQTAREHCIWPDHSASVRAAHTIK